MKTRRPAPRLGKTDARSAHGPDPPTRLPGLPDPGAARRGGPGPARSPGGGGPGRGPVRAGPGPGGTRLRGRPRGRAGAGAACGHRLFAAVDGATPVGVRSGRCTPAVRRIRGPRSRQRRELRHRLLQPQWQPPVQPRPVPHRRNLPRRQWLFAAHGRARARIQRRGACPRHRHARCRLRRSAHGGVAGAAGPQFRLPGAAPRSRGRGHRRDQAGPAVVRLLPRPGLAGAFALPGLRWPARGPRVGASRRPRRAAPAGRPVPASDGSH